MLSLKYDKAIDCAYILYPYIMHYEYVWLK